MLHARVFTALFAIALAATAQSAEPRPSHGALRRAFEKNRTSLVEVSSPRGKGAGVLVGEGLVATAVDHVSLDAANVRVGDAVHPGRVTHANAKLKVALVQFDGGSREPAAVNAKAELSRGTWLVGIQSRRRGEPKPHAGRVLRAARANDPFVITDLPLRPGAPIFDVKGRLVAIAVERIGKIGSRALPISRVRAQAEALSP